MSSECNSQDEYCDSNISSSMFESTNIGHSIPSSSNVEFELDRRNYNFNNDHTDTSWDIIHDGDESSIADSCSYVDDQFIVSKTASTAIASTSTNRSSNIGSIAVQNSSDVTFGNKNYFSGPVVIKQFFNHENPNDRNEEKNIDFDADEIQTNSWLRIHRWSRQKNILIGLAIAILIIVSIAALVVFMALRGQRSSEGDMYTSIFTVHPETENDRYEFVNRSTWGAVPARRYTDLQLPLKRVIISHTVTGDCSNMNQCSQVLQSIQKADMDPTNRNYSDIGINFFIGGDSRVYEGRGYRVGGHTIPHGGNRNSICIGFIGNFNKVVPLDGQLEAAKSFIKDGVQSNKIHPDYKLYGQRQFFATESPGDLLFAIISTWKHWSAILVNVE